MDTGRKNSKGRTILKGPRGGEYVLGADGITKIRTFKAGTAAAAPRPKSPPKNKMGRIIYRGPKGGLFVYTNASKTKKLYTVHASANNKARAKASYSPLAVVLAPPPPAAPPAVANTSKLPTPSPRPVISSAERARRLAAIRARLNAMRAKYIREKPRARGNVENRLRLAVRRVRARLNERRSALAGWPTTHVRVPFCHAPASVPRKTCTQRFVNLPVYGDGNPLIESGAIVAMQVKDFDLDWFRRQNAYVSRLSDYDFWTVQAHTNRSHSWIGPYTYKGNIPTFRALGGAGHLVPLWPQIRKMILNGTYTSKSGWVRDFKTLTDETHRYNLLKHNLPNVPANIKREALEMYKKDLKRIIAGAPKTKKKMIVYRGSGFDIFKGNPGHWYKLKSFCSGAYNVNHALGYGTMVTRVTVLPGSPVLLVAGTNQWGRDGEYEIMVNLDTHYLIRGRDVQRQAYYNDSRLRSWRGYRVTDVTIAR